MNNEERLQREVSRLETLNDFLITELSYIDHLVRSIGFGDGIETLKMAMEDAIRINKN